jgi:hypothetical protein
MKMFLKVNNDPSSELKGPASQFAFNSSLRNFHAPGRVKTRRQSKSVLGGTGMKRALLKRALLKRTLAGLMFLIFAGAGSMMAQDGYGYYHRDRDLRGDYADRRADIRDIRRDEAKIAHDRWELRRDLYEGNYRAAAHEREELRREYRDINRDRADVYRDTRDIRRDERERYWYGR